MDYANAISVCNRFYKIHFPFIFRYRFIYDLNISPNFELTYLWFFMATYNAMFLSLATDGLFYAAALNLSGHFKIIQNNIENLKFEQSTMSGVQLSENVRQVVKYHKKVKRLITDLNEIYKPVLLLQFALTSFQICVIGYQLTLVSNLSVNLKKFVLKNHIFFSQDKI